MRSVLLFCCLWCLLRGLAVRNASLRALLGTTGRSHDVLAGALWFATWLHGKRRMGGGPSLTLGVPCFAMLGYLTDIILGAKSIAPLVVLSVLSRRLLASSLAHQCAPLALSLELARACALVPW